MSPRWLGAVVCAMASLVLMAPGSPRPGDRPGKPKGWSLRGGSVYSDASVYPDATADAGPSDSGVCTEEDSCITTIDIDLVDGIAYAGTGATHNVSGCTIDISGTASVTDGGSVISVYVISAFYEETLCTGTTTWSCTTQLKDGEVITILAIVEGSYPSYTIWGEDFFYVNEDSCV